MSITRGDVVLMNAPFVGGVGSKIRPVLVIQNDANNARMKNTIVALITTNTSRASQPTQVLIDLSTSDGRQSGLIQDSAVACETVFTVLQGDIFRTIGRLPISLMQQVNDALKASLALP